MYRCALPYLCALALGAVAPGCGNQDGGDPAVASSGTPFGDAPRASAQPAAPAPAGQPAGKAAPSAPFPGGKRAFEIVLQTLRERYYGEGLTDEQLYRAATQGMLENADPAMRKWNKLLSPAEMAELRADLKGEVVGVGVRIDFDPATGYSRVLGTLAGSPAERAGLASGDLIVSVDGMLFKGKELGDVIASIRGKAGDKVSVTFLRGGELLSYSLAREVVAYEPAYAMGLPEAVGYLRIHSFTEKTPAAVSASMDTLFRQGTRALIVDLRDNPGGSFDHAVETAGLLLPVGREVVVIAKRGEPATHHRSEKSAPLTEVPIVVLVNGGTSSGAEFVSAALAEGRNARLVGQKTFGKWTVQALEDLPNDWAFKYTVSVFRTPAGKSYEGQGLTPEVEVSMDAKALEQAMHVKDPAQRVAGDAQLRTAVTLLSGK
jgi:carboxyl-terminal processing protease